MARALIVTHGVSVSQACRAVDIDRKTFSYEPKKRGADEVIVGLLRALSAQHPTYGLQKLFDLIHLKNHPFNHKRVYRIYCELKLNLKIKPKKCLAERTPMKLIQPLRLNQCWSLDYMSDALISGRKFRTANVLDDCNRGGLGILASFSLTSRRITRWLDQIAQTTGYPDRIRVDKERKQVAADLRRIYTATTVEQAEIALGEFEQKWDSLLSASPGAETGQD